MQKLLRALWRAANAIGVALKTLVRELRDVLRDNGCPSWSRYGSAAIVATWCYVAVRTRTIPEHTEMVGVILAALYGANQLPKIAQAIAQAKAAAAPVQPTDQSKEQVGQ